MPSHPQLNIRIPPDLKRRIEEAARTNGRSMNAEVLARLDASFAEHFELAAEIRLPDDLGSEALHDLMPALEAVLARRAGTRSVHPERTKAGQSDRSRPASRDRKKR